MKLKEKLFLGKEYLKIKNKDKKIKFLEKSIYQLLIFTFIFILIGVGFVGWEFYEYMDNYGTFEYGVYEDYDIKTEFEYYNLTNEQEEKTREILTTIKPIYFEKINKIIFTSDISEQCDNCVGINFAKRKEIYVLYNKNERRFKEVLCHEILHSYIKLNKDLEEVIVDDIEKYLVCFKG